MNKHVKTLFRKLWHYVPFGCFLAAILGLCFAYGLAVGRWQLFPFSFLRTGFDSLKIFLKIQPPHYLHPARYKDEGVVVLERNKVFPGVTLISGAWRDEHGHHLGARLIDLDGKLLHEWQTNPRDIWKKSPHRDSYVGSYDDKTKTLIHGIVLLPDGDIVFNLECFGLIRMDSRSEVVWKLPYRTHHSVRKDNDGKFWVCGMKWRETLADEYPDLKPPFIEDTIIKVSSDGVIEREISLLEVIYKSGYDGLLRVHKGDVLHLNDVEVLERGKANAFRGIFSTGDIMVSMHHANTVCVIDGGTERIKWSLTHPFIGQHDPDFTVDGYITVFDNHSGWEGSRYESRGSRIVRIEPASKSVETLYGWKEDQYFFTSVGGKHQQLPNGNMLITEAIPGRIFEIDPAGEIVWAWIVGRWNEKYVPEIMQGTRYGEEFASFFSGLRKDEK